MPPQPPPDLLPRTRQIILPLVNTEDDREALLTDAFYLLPDSRLYHQIKREGSAMGFTTLCIKKLIDYGCVTADTHAISQLLSASRLYCGVDKHTEIDDLIRIANTICTESDGKPGQTESDPAPVETQTARVQTIDTPREERTPTVFISYSHKDDDFAQKLMADMNKAGHACWIDTSAIKGGADWQRAICDGINLSYALIVVCTHQALRSEYVWDEIQWARTRRKLIIPVLLEDVTQDDRFFGLHRFQGIRFDTLPYNEAFSGLLEALPAAPTAEDRAPVVRTVSRREHELAYLDRLRFDDFRLEKFELAEYAALGGVAQAHRETLDSWERLAMEQEFAVIQDTGRDSDESEGASEAFTDAVSKIDELRRAVMLGDPGAGKTHTLRAIAKPLYTTALKDPKAPLPLLVKLGNWDDSTQPFENFLREELGELGDHLDDLLQAGRAVLLFDGLNEFPANQRKRKYPQVETFIKQHPEAMAVVTCREADYPISLKLNKVLIRPLDPLRIRDFSRRALRAVETDDTFFWKLVGEGARRFEARFKERFGDQLTDWENTFWLAKTLPGDLDWDWDFVNGVHYSWELWLTVRDDPGSILTLARNPYMLRMLLDVYIQFKGVLPANRGQLFAQFVDVLLERENLAEIDPDTKVVTIFDEGQQLLTGLQQVAFEMQVQRASRTQEGESSAGTSLPLTRVREILNDRLLYLAVSTSILNSGDDVRFTHQLLQEYFAARYMDRAIQSGQLQAADIWPPEKWWERTNWEEAAILLAGLYSDDCSQVVEWVNQANPEAAALCVTRSGAKLPDETRDRLRAEWIPRLTALTPSPSPSGRGEIYEPNPHARAAVGRALGLTNWDNRKGVGVIALTLNPSPQGEGLDSPLLARSVVGRGAGGEGTLLPDIDWVDIPGGEFIYGDDNKDGYPDYAKPADQQKLTLPAFKISRYPVTYAQFQTFIDDPEGFHDPRWWEGLAIPEGHNNAPGDQRFKYWNHPRENVSWYDAIAFCRWLSWRYEQAGLFSPLPAQRLGEGSGVRAKRAYDPMNPATWAVRLPTEFEWERAARGTDGREYPWGDGYKIGYANINETSQFGSVKDGKYYLSQTSAVGIYPQGASPEGVLDLSGNVWEWCLTDRNEPQRNPGDENIRSSAGRVLRGGAWLNYDLLARAALRLNYAPNSRAFSLGFRLVAPPSLEHLFTAGGLP